MDKYEPQKFIDELIKRKRQQTPLKCPFCGHDKFTTTNSLASVLIGKDLNGVSLGPTIPSGMLICENCGHIEFFALGVLGLLPIKGDDDNGK